TRHGFPFGARVLSPQADSLDGIAERSVDGLATRRAAGKIGHDDAVCAGLAVYEYNVTGHLLILLPSRHLGDLARDPRRKHAMARHDNAPWSGRMLVDVMPAPMAALPTLTLQARGDLR